MLFSHRGKIFSTSDIRRELCYQESSDPTAIEKYILRLKKKIGEQCMRTITGFGYKFEAG